MKYKITKSDVKETFGKAKRCYIKAKPKIKRVRRFSKERGMQINRDLAKPIKINRRTTGI